MKRIPAQLLSILAVLCLSVSGVFASEAADAARESTFTISVYNDLTGEYVLENQTFTAVGITVFRTINFLAAEEEIAGFTQSESELLELRYYLPFEEELSESSGESSGASGEADGETDEESGILRETALLRSNDVERFYVKRNGVPVLGDGLNRYMRDGDIIEWIYGVPPETVPDSPKEEEILPALPAEIWSEEALAVMNSACSWLNRNPDTHTLYLTSMGSAGKTADLQAVTSLLNDIRAGAPEIEAEALAKAVLNLSYSGYDRSDADLSGLLSRLTELSPEDVSMETRALTLIAYDSRNYTIPNAAAGSRSRLIEGILALQLQSGGFAAKNGGREEVDATALALTALSGYVDQPVVEQAVQKGIAYLANAQMEKGGFRTEGQVNSRSTALVITALCSLDMKLNEQQFIREGKNLLDLLLEYAGEDGGFAMNPGGISSLPATETAVIALSAVRRDGNPYLVPASLKSSVPAAAAPSTVIPETPDSGGIYLTIGLGCLAVFLLLLILLIYNLKRERRSLQAEKNAASEEEED